VFESAPAFERFVEAVRPVAQEVGIEEPLVAHAAHTVVWR
jgi:hypothetical protein